MTESKTDNSCCDPAPDTSWRPKSSSSTCSFHSDEGYNSDEKRHPEREKEDNGGEIPVLKSTRTICISYRPATYALTLTIILFSLHILISHPPPWAHTFPPFFVFFQLAFQITHLVAHRFGRLGIERACVVYGTWLFWTGWLLGVFVFSERLTIDLTHPTTILFWMLMLERRNAWGIIVWEFLSRLEADRSMTHMPHMGSSRLLIFRTWCLFGTGSVWGLIYITLAKYDGYTLVYLLQFSNIMKLLAVSAAGGLIMICFWSFLTFQYRGVIWRRELRQGIVVWYSEGIARAGDVK